MTAVTTADTETTAPRQRPHWRSAPLHVLALARVRSLSARPVGPFRVRRAHQDPTDHQ